MDTQGNSTWAIMPDIRSRFHSKLAWRELMYLWECCSGDGPRRSPGEVQLSWDTMHIHLEEILAATVVATVLASPSDIKRADP
jgi:hypothetical protein